MKDTPPPSSTSQPSGEDKSPGPWTVTFSLNLDEGQSRALAVMLYNSFLTGLSRSSLEPPWGTFERYFTLPSPWQKPTDL